MSSVNITISQVYNELKLANGCSFIVYYQKKLIGFLQISVVWLFPLAARMYSFNSCKYCKKGRRGRAMPVKRQVAEM